LQTRYPCLEQPCQKQHGLHPTYKVCMYIGIINSDDGIYMSESCIFLHDRLSINTTHTQLGLHCGESKSKIWAKPCPVTVK
jgi:hypothetical protein